MAIGEAMRMWQISGRGYLKLVLSLCVLSSILLLPCCNSYDNEDLFASLNSLRTDQNKSALAVNVQGQCLAEHVARDSMDTPCLEKQLTLNNPGISSSYKALHACGTQWLHVPGARILQICVNNTYIRSASLGTYIELSPPEYEMLLSSEEFASVGIATQNDYIVLVLATNTTTGNLARVKDKNQADEQANVGIFSILLAFVVATSAAYYVSW